jgi:hypothetical protein
VVQVKKLTVATGGFKVRKRAWSTLQGLESLRMINKGQFDLWFLWRDLLTCSDFAIGL